MRRETRDVGWNGAHSHVWDTRRKPTPLPPTKPFSRRETDRVRVRRGGGGRTRSYEEEGFSTRVRSSRSSAGKVRPGKG